MICEMSFFTLLLGMRDRSCWFSWVLNWLFGDENNGKGKWVGLEGKLVFIFWYFYWVLLVCLIVGIMLFVVIVVFVVEIFLFVVIWEIVFFGLVVFFVGIFSLKLFCVVVFFIVVFFVEGFEGENFRKGFFWEVSFEDEKVFREGEFMRFFIVENGGFFVSISLLSEFFFLNFWFILILGVLWIIRGRVLWKRDFFLECEIGLEVFIFLILVFVFFKIKIV